MGDFNVRILKDNADRSKVYHQIYDDLSTFDQMLNENMFDDGPAKIGAEQEICLVDANCNPDNTALSILNEIGDPHYTNELALYNLEVNLDPYLLSGDCFTKTENSLIDLLNLGRSVAANHGSQLLLTGILPTLKYQHLEFEYMTPIERYKALSGKFAELRGGNFEIYLQGIDDLIMSLPTVLFEACNTSFQLHLQIKPSEFVNQYNWSQMIAGPVLSACVNSPILFGLELWAETRIAIFKQSLDTRSSTNQMRKKLSRVYFGNQWLEDSPVQLFKEQIIRFPVIVTSDHFEQASDVLKKGAIPNLRAAMLHNGTTYTWNRICYGAQGSKPHLRIECRYLPAGPSPADEVANFIFWIGLMRACPEDWQHRYPKVDFKLVKNNFIKAARYGLDTVFDWFGEKIQASTLLLDHLIPMARQGLYKSNVKESDIIKYLGIFESRVRSGQTGSQWSTTSFRQLQQKHGIDQSLHELTAISIQYQVANIPVHEWEIPTTCQHYIRKDDERLVHELMNSDITTIQDDQEISFALNILSWKSFHHLPVENHRGELVGLITDGILNRHIEEGISNDLLIKDIMLTNVISLSANDTIPTALEIMKENNLAGLPVTFNGKLVGIITLNDLNAD
jgi:CBS domain-containing protein